MTTGINLDEYFTAAEVAQQLKCTPKHVNTLRKRGELVATAIGGMYRYAPEDLNAYLRKQKGKAAA